MATHGIVKGFDIVKDHGLGLGSVEGMMLLKHSVLRVAQKGFSSGIIIAICSAAHALIDTELIQG